MTSNNTTPNLKSISSEALDWAVIQKDMKNKLGSDIYESWLRKIDFVEEMNSNVYFQFLLDLSEIGLPQDI
jgi:chromosomal replication initiator protein